MRDITLVYRLRNYRKFSNNTEAADRIEELEQQRDKMFELLKAIQGGEQYTVEFCQRIDAVIAEIEAAK